MYFSNIVNKLYSQRFFLIRFLFAGIANTLVHLGVFTVLHSKGVNIVFSNIVAFLFANFFSFFSASFWVFNTRKVSLSHYTKFLMISFVGVIISWFIGWWFETSDLNPFFSVLVVAGIIPPISYLLQKGLFLSDN